MITVWFCYARLIVARRIHRLLYPPLGESTMILLLTSSSNILTDVDFFYGFDDVKRRAADNCRDLLGQKDCAKTDS